MQKIYLYMYIRYIYQELVCSLFLKVHPPKQGPFQSKQGSFGFQVYTLYSMYMYVYMLVQRFADVANPLENTLDFHEP